MGSMVDRMVVQNAIMRLKKSKMHEMAISHNRKPYRKKAGASLAGRKEGRIPWAWGMDRAWLENALS